MKNIDKQDIEDILLSSKEENKKYLNRVLRIKNLSSFDVAYIMGSLKLNDNKIKLIEYSISKYFDYSEIKANESINEYIFDIVKNIEKLEESNDELLDEIETCRSGISSFKNILNYLIQGNISFIKLKNSCGEQNIVFSKVYFDK